MPDGILDPPRKLGRLSNRKLEEEEEGSKQPHDKLRNDLQSPNYTLSLSSAAAAAERLWIALNEKEFESTFVLCSKTGCAAAPNFI